MARQRTDLETLWRGIEQAGTIEAYVDQQLRERGFLIERQETTQMSKRELAQYKKQLKQEAAEKRRLKADAWQAYKTKHIVHLGDGVFWNEGLDWDKWDIENAEERASENGLPPLDKPKQLAEALGITIGELRWLAYHRDVARQIHYRRFTIPKKDGSDRAIWAPLPKLKAVQHWILRNILERLLVHGAVHGFLPGRSIVTNATTHVNSKIVLKMDLKDFFPTITLPRIKGVFRHAGYRGQLATLLALLCSESPREEVQSKGETFLVSTSMRSLPQGAPTSPALTNVVCLKMDRRLTGLAEKFAWRYTRYADDLTFSLPETSKGDPHLGKLIGLTRKVVSDEGFAIHPEKTRIMRKGARQKVTGLIVNQDQPPRMPRQIRRQLRAVLHNLESGKSLQEGESIDRFIGYAAMLHSTNVEEGTALLNGFLKHSND